MARNAFEDPDYEDIKRGRLDPQDVLRTQKANLTQQAADTAPTSATSRTVEAPKSAVEEVRANGPQPGDTREEFFERANEGVARGILPTKRPRTDREAVVQNREIERNETQLQRELNDAARAQEQQRKETERATAAQAKEAAAAAERARKGAVSNFKREGGLTERDAANREVPVMRPDERMQGPGTDGQPITGPDVPRFKAGPLDEAPVQQNGRWFTKQRDEYGDVRLEPAEQSTHFHEDATTGEQTFTFKGQKLPLGTNQNTVERNKLKTEQLELDRDNQQERLDLADARLRRADAKELVKPFESQVKNAESAVANLEKTLATAKGAGRAAIEQRLGEARKVLADPNYLAAKAELDAVDAEVSTREKSILDRRERSLAITRDLDKLKAARNLPATVDHRQAATTMVDAQGAWPEGAVTTDSVGRKSVDRDFVEARIEALRSSPTPASETGRGRMPKGAPTETEKLSNTAAALGFYESLQKSGIESVSGRPIEEVIAASAAAKARLEKLGVIGEKIRDGDGLSFEKFDALPAEERGAFIAALPQDRQASFRKGLATYRAMQAMNAGGVGNADIGFRTLSPEQQKLVREAVGNDEMLKVLAMEAERAQAAGDATRAAAEWANTSAAGKVWANVVWMYGGAVKGMAPLATAAPRIYSLFSGDKDGATWADNVDAILEDTYGGKGTVAEMGGELVGGMLSLLIPGGAAGIGARAAGLGAKAAKAASMTTTALAGAAINGADSVAESGALNLSEKETWTRFAIASVLGATEAFGVPRGLDRMVGGLMKLDRKTKGTFRALLEHIGNEAPKETIEEALQELVQSGGVELGDYAAGIKTKTDKLSGERRAPTFGEVVGDAVGGAVMGATAGLVFGSLFAANAHAHDRQALRQFSKTIGTDGGYGVMHDMLGRLRGELTTARNEGRTEQVSVLKDRIELAQQALGEAAKKVTSPEVRTQIASAIGADAAGLGRQLEENEALRFASIEIGQAMRAGYPQMSVQGDAATQAAADQLLGAHVVNRDLVNVLEGGKIEQSKAEALDRLGLIEMDVQDDGTSIMRVTDDALALFPPALREAVANDTAGKYNFKVTAGQPGALVNNLVKSGEDRLRQAAEAKNAATAQSSNPESAASPATAVAPARTASTPAQGQASAGKYRVALSVEMPGIGSRSQTIEVAAANEAEAAKVAVAQAQRSAPRGSQVRVTGQPVATGNAGGNVSTKEPKLDRLGRARQSFAQAYQKAKTSLYRAGVGKVEESAEKSPGPMALSNDGGTLYFNPEQIATLIESKRAEDALATVLDEERWHALGVAVIKREEAEEIARTAPKGMLRAARKVYNDWDKLNDYQRGHELVRMVLQGRYTGRITEQIYKAIEKVLAVLQRYAREITDDSSLGRAVARVEALVAEIDRQEKLSAEESQESVDDSGPESSIGKGAIVRSKTYASEGEIQILGEAEPMNGRQRYEAYFSATKRAGMIFADDITEVVSVPTEPEKAAAAGQFEIATPQGNRKVRGRWRVVEASELTTSDRPDYNAELQRRQRDRSASKSQVAEIAFSLDPARLGESATSDTGAPIVNTKGEVLSGNGRTMALRSVYEAKGKKAKDYRSFVERAAAELGIGDELEGMRDPVLVRMVTDYGDSNEVEFADLSNRSQLLGRSAVETAMDDGRMLLEEGLMDVFSPGENGEVLTAGNRPFNRLFIQHTGDRAQLTRGQGEFSPELEGRVRRAVLGAIMQRLPDASEAVTSALERADKLGLSRQINGVMAAAGRLLKLQRSNAEMDIAPSLAEALAGAIEARGLIESGKAKNAEDALSQGVLFAEPSEAGKILTRILLESNSAKVVREQLSEYARIAENVATGPSMFGDDAPGMTPAEVLTNIVNAGAREKARANAARGLKEALHAARVDTHHPRYESIDEAKPWLKPLTAAMRALPTNVQTAILDANDRGRIPGVPDELAPLIRNANAAYESQLERGMEKLRPKWEAYRAEFTPEIRAWYDREVTAVAEETGTLPMVGVALKGDRGMVKALDDAALNKTEPDVATINDVVRGSLVALDQEGVDRAVAAVKARFGVVDGDLTTGKHKDRFAKPLNGYKDHLIQIILPNGRRAEVQVHRVDLLFAKEVGVGHAIYEDIRKNDATLDAMPGNAGLVARAQTLKKASVEFYGGVDAAFLNSSSETDSASPSNERDTPIAARGSSLDPSGRTYPPPGSLASIVPESSRKNSVPSGNLSGSASVINRVIRGDEGSVNGSALFAARIEPQKLHDLFTAAAKEKGPIDISGGLDVVGHPGLFGKGLGVPRAEMPQVPSEHQAGFVQWLEARGIAHRDQTANALVLKPSQGELDAVRIGRLLEKEDDGKARRSFISQDGYVIDGHHRWAATIATGFKTGKMGMEVTELGVPIREALQLAAEYNRDAGIEARDMSPTTLGAARVKDTGTLDLFANPSVTPAAVEYVKAAKDSNAVTKMDFVAKAKKDGLGGVAEDLFAFAQRNPPAQSAPGFSSERKAIAADKVATEVAKILGGRSRFKSLTWETLFRLYDEAIGGTQADGVYTPKDAYDAMELGINRWILSHRGSTGQAIAFGGVLSPQDAVRQVRFLKENLLPAIPTQSKRTAETDEFQQFSTIPTLAFVANWVANVDRSDLVLEPSAGIGGIATFAKASGAEVVMNELSPRRAAILRKLGIGTVYQENAEQIDNVLPADVRPTVVEMNPPFSATAGRMQGARDTSNAVRHIEQALARLEPGGRLVAIVGSGMNMDGSRAADGRRGGTGHSFRAWWEKMQREYQVRANIQVSGAEYAKYGTTFDNQIVVIDKLPPSELTPAPVLGRVEKVEDLIPLLNSIRNERRRIDRSSAGTLGQGARPDTTVSTGSTGGAGGSVYGDGGTGGVSGAQQSGVDGSPAGGERPAAGGESVAGVVPGSDERGGTQEQRDGSGVGPESNADGVERAEVTRAEARTEGALTDAVYDAYQPRVVIAGTTMPPVEVQESSAMAAVDPITPTYRPALPESAYQPQNGAEEGKLSALAMESIVLAGNAHQEMIPVQYTDEERKAYRQMHRKEPPTEVRRGFFIGDGTGMGKGRQVAGIIYDNWLQGRKRAIWISEKPALVNDGKRDLADVALMESKIFEAGKFPLGKAIDKETGIAFMTYATLRSVEKNAPPNRAAHSRLDQLVKWFGEDFDGVIAFDESHNMANNTPMRGKRGLTKPSAQALMGLELQRRLPKARVVYLSATGATEVANLGYAERLGLWGAGTPFTNKRAFIETLTSAGLAAMELVAQNLKALGLYVARAISWRGVEYDKIEHTLSADQREIYDTLAVGWQNVLTSMDKALEVIGAVKEDASDGSKRTLNKDAKSAARSAFWGAHQRFFNQIITSMKMPTVLAAADKALANGEAVVMQLVNTNEAAQNRAIEARRNEAADNGEAVDFEDLDLTPRDILMQMVEHSFPIIQQEEYTIELADGTSRTASRPAKDSKGNPIINRQAVAMRDALLDKLGSMRVPDGPLEMIHNHFGEEKVAEVTGRTQRMEWVKDEKGERVRKPVRRSKVHGMKEADEFMQNKRRVLVFSNAGGTGRSYHADKKVKNQRVRRHILVQAGWQAAQAIQGFGRTHRNNQKQPPVYALATSDVVGEARFISSIARRLDQLGALTKGQRQTGSQGFFKSRDNLESEEAKAALTGFYSDVLSGFGAVSPDVLEKEMGLKLRDENGQPVEDKPPITQFLNRLLSLKLDTQRAVFDAFSERLDRIIESKIAAGTLDQGMENLQALSTKVQHEQVIHTDPRSGAETRYVRLGLEQETDRRTFPAESGATFVTNTRSKRIYQVLGSRRETETDTGRIVEKVKVRGVVGTKYVTDQEFADGKRWTPVGRIDARKVWEAEYEATPPTHVEVSHFITGTILPVWDRVQTGWDTMAVRRAQTDEGRRMIGVVIRPGDIKEVLNNFGITETGKKEAVTGEQAAVAIADGKTVRLANGWNFKLKTVSGEPRIELIGPDFVDHAELDTAGLFRERIGFKTRYFVPVSNAAEVIGKIVANHPVTEGAETLGAARVQAIYRDPSQGLLDFDSARPETAAIPSRETDRRTIQAYGGPAPSGSPERRRPPLVPGTAPSVAELVKGNMGLAVAITNDYRNIPGTDFDDVLAEARKALVKAARGFDPERATPFGSYAGPAIRNTLNTMFNKNAKRVAREGLSAELPTGEDGDGETLKNGLADANATAAVSAGIEGEETSAALAAALATLPPHVRRIVDLSGEGLSLREIAAEVDLSHETVRQILGNATKALQARLKERGFAGVDADGVLYAARVPGGSADKKLRFVYQNSYGERDSSIQPDTRANLGGAITGLWDDRRGGGRGIAEKFRSWAEGAGSVLDPEAWQAWARAHREIGGQSEHTVYRAGNRVVKITHADLVGDGAVGQSGNVLDYLLGHYLANGLLDDDIRLEGVVQLDGEFPQLVISQPLIQRKRVASRDEKDAYFAFKGFVRQADGSYWNAPRQVRLSDHAGDNVLARDVKRGGRAEVDVFPIDVQMRLDGETLPRFENDDHTGTLGAAAVHEREIEEEADATEKGENEEREPERPQEFLKELLVRHTAGRLDALDYVVPGAKNLLTDAHIKNGRISAALRIFRERIEENVKQSFGYPSWWRNVFNLARLKRFTAELLPTAARLNAVGRDSNDRLQFESFWMRAGEVGVKLGANGRPETGQKMEGIHGGPVTLREGVFVKGRHGEKLRVGRMVDTLTQGRRRVFWQLERFVPAEEQHKIHGAFHDRYPEAAHWLDSWIDPNLRESRVQVGGIDLPDFNRFSLHDFWGEISPFGEVGEVKGYTPDVFMTKSLVGMIAGRVKDLLNRTWTGPGREYKSGEARERGQVRNLFEGFNARAAEAHQESERRKLAEALLKKALKPIPESGVPANFVRWDEETVDRLLRSYHAVQGLDPDQYKALKAKVLKQARAGAKGVDPNQAEFLTMMGQLREEYPAVREGDVIEFLERDPEGVAAERMANIQTEMEPWGPRALRLWELFNTEKDDGSRFTAEDLARIEKLAGRIAVEAAEHRDKMIHRNALAELQRPLASQYINNRLLRIIDAGLRGATGGYLASLFTLSTNQISNEMFVTMHTLRRAIYGLMSLPFDRKQGKLGLYEAGNLLKGVVTDRWYNKAVRELVPDELFDGNHRFNTIATTEFEKSPAELLRELNVSGAVLKAMRYGNVDTRAKQRVAFASYLAHARLAWDEAQAAGKVAAGTKKGAWMKDWIENLASDAVHRSAYNAAMLVAMDYANVPPALDENNQVTVGGRDITAEVNLLRRGIAPFAKFPYNLGRQGKRYTFDSLREILPGHLKAGSIELTKGAVTSNAQKRQAAANLTMMTLMYLLARMLMDDDEQGAPKLGRELDDLGRRLEGAYQTAGRINITDTALGRTITAALDMLGLHDLQEQEQWLRIRAFPYASSAVALATLEQKALGGAAGVEAEANVMAVLSDMVSEGILLKMVNALRDQKGPYDKGKNTSFIAGETGFDVATGRFIPPPLLRTLSALADPVTRRNRPVKSLDYDPGAIEAVQMKIPGAARNLPPSGRVVIGAEGSAKSEAAVAELLARELPEGSFRRYVDAEGKAKVAYVMPSKVNLRPRVLELFRTFGLNVKFLDREEYQRELAGVE